MKCAQNKNYISSVIIIPMAMGQEKREKIKTIIGIIVPLHSVEACDRTNILPHNMFKTPVLEQGPFVIGTFWGVCGLYV